LVQVLGIATDSFEAPAWIMKLAITIIVIGFFIALIISWAYELTPEGIKRDKDVVRDDSIASVTAKKLDIITIIALLTVGSLVLWQKFSHDVGDSGLRENDELLGNNSVTSKQAEPQQNEANTPELDNNSIAVLAFVNMSSDPEQEYFSDGISEEILNVLAKIDGLKVAARTSSFMFKGQNRPVGEIAKTLGVKHVLEGSVRKSGSKVRITAQLIRADDGFHLWSDTYDRELDNIFAIQDEISMAIVKELRGRLMSETPVIQNSGTTNTQAYEEYLKGWYFWNLRTVENLYRAKEHFQRATQLDANYANAWLGLGQTLALLPLWEFDINKAAEQQDQARQAVEKALAINPNLGMGYAILGDIHLQLIQWQESLESFQLAIKYEPKIATSWQWYGGVLGSIGRIEESIEALEKALSLDPHSRIIATNLAEAYFIAGQYDAALERINKSLVTAPNFSYGILVQGYIHLALHDFDAARMSFNNYTEIDNLPKAPFIDLITGIEKFIIQGTPVPLNDVIFEAVSHDQYYASVALVLGGHYDKALDTIEQQSKTNIPIAGLYFIHSQLYKKALGDRPRYHDLVKRLATLEAEEL
jgi:TolB-like protein/Flp pilus assembly protein TadD